MKAAAISITEALADLPMLEGRRSETPEQEIAAAFTALSDYDDNARIFTGSFSGQGAWERHCMGDELVQVIAGETTLTILSEAGEDSLDLRAGMLAVVPKGQWHRFQSPGGVSLMTITPQPTEHSLAEDPRVERT